jgi:hypothetical protein
MIEKTVHIKELLLNFLFSLLESDIDNKYKETIIEISKKIHEL